MYNPSSLKSRTIIDTWKWSECSWLKQCVYDKIYKTQSEENISNKSNKSKYIENSKSQKYFF